MWHNIVNSYQLYEKEKRMEIKNFRAIHDKEYILELIEEGEHEMQDFKFSISDSRK